MSHVARGINHKSNEWNCLDPARPRPAAPQDCNAPSESFIPLILKSVTASLSRRGGRDMPAFTSASQKILGELPAGLGY